MKAAAVVLTVLTLNAAGPRRVHQGWQSRRAALAESLKSEGADVAAFQELWRGEDVAALAGAAGLPHRAHDEALGLAVASRQPLASSSARSLGWGGGALRARLSAGGKTVDAYSARLTPGAGPEAAARRAAQLFDLAEFVRAESTGSFVLLGDLAASPDEPETRLFLDLLGARDLCVSHGDETCGRTLDDRRVDYALIPYSSKPPGETARAAFTGLAGDDDEPRPLAAHFGLSARLDAAWPSLRAAAEPDGRREALEAVVDALDAARAAAERRELDAGREPWRGAQALLSARREALLLSAAAERARSALARAATPARDDWD